MIPHLPRTDTPTWLRDIDVDPSGRITTPFRARDVLERSVYYPASGLDGNPIERLGVHVPSFVFADYEARYDVATVRRELASVSGYRVLGDRLLSPAEANVAAWSHAPGPGARVGAPLALWAILERLPGHDDGHGPPRLSFLFLSADGVAAYDGLYASRGLAPTVLVVVHPGTAFGGNWTDFADPHGPLCAAVLGDGRPPPELLYSHPGPGGTAPWPFYDEHLATLHAGADVHLWRRPRP